MPEETPPLASHAYTGIALELPVHPADAYVKPPYACGANASVVPAVASYAAYRAGAQQAPAPLSDTARVLVKPKPAAIAAAVLEFQTVGSAAI